MIDYRYDDESIDIQQTPSTPEINEKNTTIAVDYEMNKHEGNTNLLVMNDDSDISTSRDANVILRNIPSVYDSLNVFGMSAVEDENDNSYLDSQSEREKDIADKDGNFAHEEEIEIEHEDDEFEDELEYEEHLAEMKDREEDEEDLDVRGLSDDKYQVYGMQNCEVDIHGQSAVRANEDDTTGTFVYNSMAEPPHMKDPTSDVPDTKIDDGSVTEPDLKPEVFNDDE